MSPQTPIISLLIILTSLLLCNGYYIEEPLLETKYEQFGHYYNPVHDERLIKRENGHNFGHYYHPLIREKHEHFGHVTRANNRATPLSSRPGGTVSVDDFGAKADGRDDTQVNISYQQKGETFFPCEFNPFLMSINYLFF